MLKGLAKDCVTEKDGISFCPLRIAFIIGLVGYFIFTMHDVFYAKDLHFMDHAHDWVSGLANYLGLGGAAIAGKNFSEEPQ